MTGHSKPNSACKITENKLKGQIILQEILKKRFYERLSKDIIVGTFFGLYIICGNKDKPKHYCLWLISLFYFF